MGFSGSIGFTGSGAIGYTGSSGNATVGFTGSFGFAGSRGNLGYTGSSGNATVGFSGSFGFAGSRGDLGYTGSSGNATVGFSGSIGFTGSGATGYTGSSGNATVGFSGSFGFAGSRGDLGYTGSSGNASVGFTGSQGTTGFVGSKGDQGPAGGYTGSRGDTGFVGSQGLQGPAGGYTGSRGDTGFVGSKGDPGGPIGYTGSRGTTGFNGSLGYTGSTGAGFTGSASTVQGPLGYTGSRAFTGSAGWTGSAGAGFTGSASTQPGFVGSFGYTGSRGTTGFTGSLGIGQLGYTGSAGTTFSGVVGLTDGSNAAPSLYFTSETDTGLFKQSAGTMGVTVLGGQKVAISNTQTSLTTPLAGTTATFTTSGTTNSLNQSGITISNTVSAVKLEVVNGQLSTVQNSQLVTSVFRSLNNNTSLLEISEVRGITGSSWETAGIRLQQRIDATYMGYIQFNTGTSVSNSGGFSIGTGTAGSLNAVVERMRITSTGNVGIGTTSPENKLHIVTATDSIVISEGSNGYGSFLASGSGNNSAYMFFKNNNRSTELARIEGFNGGGMLFATGNSATERMRITNTGNVGIGTNSPGYKLDVAGDINLTGTIYKAVPDNDFRTLVYASMSGSDAFQIVLGGATDQGAVYIDVGDNGDEKIYFRRVIPAGVAEQREIFKDTRIKLDSNFALYVSPSGNDSNSGLTTGSSLATIQRAWDILKTKYDLNGFQAYILLQSGSYNQQLSVYGSLVGQNLAVIIQPWPGDAGLVDWYWQPPDANPNGNLITCVGAWIALVGNIKLSRFNSPNGTGPTDGSSGWCIACQQNGNVIIQYIEFASAPAGHMVANYGGQITISGPYSISAGTGTNTIGGRHILAGDNGTIVTNASFAITLKGANMYFDIFAVATWLGTIIYNSNAVSFAYGPGASVQGTRFVVNYNSGIRISSNNLDYFPGSIAGYTDTSTGGRYA